LRNADAEPAACRDGAAEFFGKFAVAVALEPIIVAKARADFFYRLAQRKLKVGKSEVDGGCSQACINRLRLALNVYLPRLLTAR